MKDINIQFSEALAQLKKTASASKYNEVAEKFAKLPTIEAKLNSVEAAIAEVVKESSPLGLTNLDEAKRDYPVLFGVEPRAAVTTKESKRINHHNGRLDNFDESNPLQRADGRPADTAANSRRHDPFAKGDLILAEAAFKRGDITADQLRKLKGLAPAEVEKLTEKQRKEYDTARLFNISEADSLILARMV
jgi:hypothetical protein